MANDDWRRRATRALIEEFSIPVRSALVQMLSATPPQFSFNRTRTLALRLSGLKVGRRSLVMGPLFVTGTCGVELVEIGNDTYITGPLRIDVGDKVRIGDRVHIGHDVLLLTVSHQFGPTEERCGHVVSAPISVGDGAWISSRVTILPGVTVGKGAVVAAGAVVTRDVPPDTIVAGVPATIVRQFEGDGPPVSVRSERLSSRVPPQR